MSDENPEHYILFAQKLSAARHDHQLLPLSSPMVLLHPLILSVPKATGLAQTTVTSHWAVRVQPIYPTSTPASSSLPSLAFQNTPTDLASWLKGSQRCPQHRDSQLCGAPSHSTLPARPLLLWFPGSRGSGPSSNRNEECPGLGESAACSLSGASHLGVGGTAREP